MKYNLNQNASLSFIFLMAGFLFSVNTVGFSEPLDRGQEMTKSTQNWEPKPNIKTVTTGGEKGTHTIMADGVGSIRYQFPQPFKFREIEKLKILFKINTPAQNYNIHIGFFNGKAGTASYIIHSVNGIFDKTTTAVELTQKELSCFNFDPAIDDCRELRVDMQGNDQPKATTISVEGVSIITTDGVIKKVSALREAYSGGQIIFTVEPTDPKSAKMVCVRMLETISGNLIDKQTFVIKGNGATLTYPIPAGLKPGFYTFCFAPDGTDATTPYLTLTHVIYLLPEVDLIALDADRVCFLPGEKTNVTAIIENHSERLQLRRLVVDAKKQRFLDEEIRLLPRQRLSKAFVLSLPDHDRVIVEARLYKAKEIEASQAVPLYRGTRRPALTRGFRVFINGGGETPEAPTGQMVEWLSRSGIGGISCPGPAIDPVMEKLVQKYSFPVTAEYCFGGDGAKFQLGCEDPQGVRYIQADQTLRGTLERYKAGFEPAFKTPIPNLIELKIVEPVAMYSAPQYAACVYSADAIKKFKKCLDNKDEGLRILYNKRFIKRVDFAYFYKFYEGRPLDKECVGLKSWDDYQPIPILHSMLAEPAKLTEDDNRKIQLLFLLQRYINTQLLDSLSQHISSHGVDCGLIPSFYANISGRDLYFSYALPYIDTYYEEPFDSAYNVLNSAERGGADLRALADKFDKRIALCTEVGQPQGVAYWGTKTTWAMVYGYLAAYHARDIQVDFWERIPGPSKAADEYFNAVKTRVEAAAYFQRHPAQSLNMTRKVWYVSKNMRYYTELTPRFKKINELNDRLGRNPALFSYKFDDLFLHGYRANAIQPWTLHDEKVNYRGFSDSDFFEKDDIGNFIPITETQARSIIDREISTDAGDNILSAIYKSTIQETEYHIVLIDKRERELCYQHYHKRASDFENFKTMDELEEELPLSKPVKISIFMPLPSGVYNVVDVFSGKAVASFVSSNNRVEFIVPGIKVAGLYRIYRSK